VKQLTLNYSHNGVISATLPNTLPKFWLIVMLAAVALAAHAIAQTANAAHALVQRSD
jgi:hypothetical protein